MGDALTRGARRPPRSRSGAALALVVLLATSCTESETETIVPASVPPPVGLSVLTDLAALAELRPPGYRVEQVSSYDRTGGNTDLGVGPDTAELPLLGVPPVEVDNSYLYREGDRYIIFDSVGPGVVYRIWMTGLDALFRNELAGDIAFELDDEASPRLTLGRRDLFSGAQPPFLAPLAGNFDASSGGFYSVVPIPFAHHLRITTSTVPNWVHITAARLPADAVIDSFDPNVDASDTAARLAATGADPKGITPTLHAAVDLDVAAGASQLAWDYRGPGTIVRLELHAPAGAEIPVGLRLQAIWDDAAAPQIDVPLDDFFGASLGPGARSLAFGQEGDRSYCYFPMPFHDHAQIVVRNDAAVDVSGWRLEIAAVDSAIGTRPAYFHASARTERVAAGASDYTLLDTSGTGHVVGVVLTAGCAESGRCQLPQLPGLDGAHLEGDERISIDGSRYPQLHGTGLEDFFNGGFYFIRGPFTLPTHGNPAQVPTTSPRRPGINLRSTYRLFLGDAIPFYDHIHLAIQHGPTNDVPADMSSVVFYYAVASSSLVEDDTIIIGSQESESAHTFTAEERTDRTLRSTFRGDDDSQPIDATGTEATRTMFRVAADANNHGLRLRRLADIGASRQSADVYVDGHLVGSWYSAEVNTITRWADLDFDIPASFTRGHSAVDIEIDARQSPTPWTAFGYTVFSYHD